MIYSLYLKEINLQNVSCTSEWVMPSGWPLNYSSHQSIIAYLVYHLGHLVAIKVNKLNYYRFYHYQGKCLKNQKY
jgi:hypothetical protein